MSTITPYRLPPFRNLVASRRRPVKPLSSFPPPRHRERESAPGVAVRALKLFGAQAAGIAAVQLDMVRRRQGSRAGSQSPHEASPAPHGCGGCAQSLGLGRSPGTHHRSAAHPETVPSTPRSAQEARRRGPLRARRATWSGLRAWRHCGSRSNRCASGSSQR